MSPGAAGAPPLFRLTTAVALLAGTVAAAQQVRSTAEQVYADASASVLLIETRDETHTATGQATAFVVARDLLLTNAHAIEGASVWVKVGGIVVPAAVERTDALNDLALLRVRAETSLHPLAFATTDPSPGARVFALGNPKGFERTITEGLLTGARTVDGRRMFQMSAAIARGSSGGPVLNERGEVVGVAVAMLRDTQGISFAVPASVAVRLITNAPAAPVDTAAGRERVTALLAQRRLETYSEQESSRYQRLTAELRAAVAQLLPATQSEDIVHLLYADLEPWAPELAWDVAKDAATRWPESTTALRNLADATRTVAESESDTPRRTSRYREAEALAERAAAASAGESRRSALRLLGEIRSELPDRRELAVAAFHEAMDGARGDATHVIWLALFDLYRTLERYPDAKRSYEAAAALRTVPGGAHDAAYGDVLERLGEYGPAADAYLRGAGTTYHHACDAARTFWLAEDTDRAMSAARRCLADAGTHESGERHAAYAHRLLSHMLLERGVVDQAVSHARQAIATMPEDGLSFAALTSAFLRAERWSEAESAARSAIRLTDGAHSSMHFALGTALFGQERWSEARSAFEQAAKMNPADSASAFNAGLAFLKMHFYQDAASWFEEALRRDPALEDAESVRARIATLRTH